MVEAEHRVVHLVEQRPWLSLYGRFLKGQRQQDSSPGAEGAEGSAHEPVPLALIQQLPDELVLSVLHLLPPYVLGKVALVCRHWRLLIEVRRAVSSTAGPGPGCTVDGASGGRDACAARHQGAHQCPPGACSTLQHPRLWEQACTTAFQLTHPTRPALQKLCGSYRCAPRRRHPQAARPATARDLHGGAAGPAD